MESVIRIGELAGRVGLTTKTIRYYEDVGLMPPPPRSEGGEVVPAAVEFRAALH